MVYAAATQFKPQGNFKSTGGKPRAIKVLHRGNILQPREDVRPGTLPIFEKENFEFNLAAEHPESDRRAALAQWITRADNPLTQPQHRQPHLALALRAGHRGDAQRLWPHGPTAKPSRAARLVGRGVPRFRRQLQTPAQIDRDQQHLSADVIAHFRF